ncbi:hypothetical protein HDU96_001416, partial [Phlyctochytrium bullatum]
MALRTLAALTAAAAGALLISPSLRRRVLPDTALASLFMAVFNSPVGYYLYRYLAPKGPEGGHRKIIKAANEFEAGPFRVIPVPYGEDNYAYIVLDIEENPDRILSVLDRKPHPLPTIKAILTTHHHWDHSGGNSRLLSLLRRRGQLSGVEVVGSAVDFPAWSLSNTLFRRVGRRVTDGEEVRVGRMVFKVVEVPCHTKGSVVFIFDIAASLAAAPRPVVPEPWSDPSTPAGGASRANTEPDLVTIPASQAFPVQVFAGDAVFVGGCGRFFEGTAGDMHAVVERL